MTAPRRFTIEEPPDADPEELLPNSRIEPWLHDPKLAFPLDSSLPLLAALGELLESLESRRN